MRDTASKSSNLRYTVELRRVIVDIDTWTVNTETGYEFLNTTSDADSMELYEFLENLCSIAVRLYNLFKGK